MTMRQCTYPECGRPHKGHGLCNGHLEQKRKGVPLKPIKLIRKPRTVDEIILRDSLGKKLCTSCLEWKYESDFYKHDKNHDKLQVRCKRCCRSASLVGNFGISLDDLEHLLENQNWKCRICSDEIYDSKVQHVDHDHSCCSGVKTCGRCVRGILCPRCNKGLGNFRDSSEALRSAADYLEEYSRSNR